MIDTPAAEHASTAEITIVVATHNRGAVVSRALRTVIAQTETNWQALVIGDACTDDTGERIAALGDARIRFVNLPQRFGEQAGPNSVGMALADTPFVAFLNHDDYWLPDHLATAVESLEASGADMYWSRAAYFTNRGAWDDRVFFSDVTPPGRRLEDLYHKTCATAEPLSAWVARRDALNRLGPMTLASQTALMPIVDYCLRAARLGLHLNAGPKLTVLKDQMWHAPPLYHNTADYAEDWVRLIEAGETDGLVQQIEQDLWLSTALGLNLIFFDMSAGDSPIRHARLDRESGLNLTEMQAGARGGESDVLGLLLSSRTGDNIRHQPHLEDMVAYARGVLV